MKTRTLTRNEFSSLSSSVRYFLLDIEVATSFPICVSLEEKVIRRKNGESEFYVKI